MNLDLFVTLADDHLPTIRGFPRGENRPATVAEAGILLSEICPDWITARAAAESYRPPRWTGCPDFRRHIEQHLAQLAGESDRDQATLAAMAWNSVMEPLRLNTRPTYYGFEFPEEILKLGASVHTRRDPKKEIQLGRLIFAFSAKVEERAAAEILALDKLERTQGQTNTARSRYSGPDGVWRWLDEKEATRKGPKARL